MAQDNSSPKPSTSGSISKVKKSKPPAPAASSSGLSTTHLFLLVLITSIGINCYIQWKKESAVKIADDEGVKKLKTELKEANELVELMKKDQIQLEKMFSISKIIEHAQAAKPEIRFASDDTRADLIAKTAIATLKTPFASCQVNVPVEKYDDYKNCFRDLAIELHNRLERQLPDSHFFIAAGRLHYSFFVTTMTSQRSEYFISFEDVLFEVLEYSQLISEPAKQEEEVTAPEEETEEVAMENQTIVEL